MAISYFECLRLARSLAEFEDYSNRWCDVANIKETNPFGQTLLHAAITDYTKSDKANYLKFLLDKGCDPLIRDHKGATVLYEIINQDYIPESEVKTLAQLVDVTYNATVFNYPVKGSSRYLLDDQHTALSLSCCKRFSPLVSELLERGASVDTTFQLGLVHPCYNSSGGYKPIKASLLHGLVEHSDARDIDRVIPIAQLLVDKGLPIDIAPDAEKITPFMLACGRGNEPLARWLFSKGAQINAITTNGETPLNFAFSHFRLRPDVSLIRTLIANGAILGPKSTKFDFAKNVHLCGDFSFFHEELLKVLNSISPNEPKLISLWFLSASANCYLESMEAVFLSSHPFDINVSEGRGMTPFLFAAAEGNQQIIQRLLAKGADEMRRTKDGQCALHLAAVAGNAEILKILIPLMREYLNISSDAQKSPLTAAIEADRAACVSTLIEAGADYSEETFQLAEKQNRSSEIVTYLRTLPLISSKI